MHKIIHKNVGVTPLEAIEQYRMDHPEYADVPMTYAGRLDPMAEGKLLILIGDECKNKEKYLGLDKEYEVEILFGVDTDTHDVLGRILEVDAGDDRKAGLISKINLQKYVGKFEQEYPAYSSKTIGGKALHVHARAGTLPENSDLAKSPRGDHSDWPKKSVEIYAIEILDQGTRSGSAVARAATEKIGKLNEKTEGDFRKKEIVQDWQDFEKKYGEMPFPVLKIHVACSSGTYMRSLAKRLGNDIGGNIGEAAGDAPDAIAFSIRRKKIGEY